MEVLGELSNAVGEATTAAASNLPSDFAAVSQGATGRFMAGGFEGGANCGVMVGGGDPFEAGDARFA